tara:strand:+ start:1453 stop:1878 length:426 start_codon:yes stop_codon:yes gene_type:complete
MWTLPVNDRLSYWREFRTKNSNKSKHDFLETTSIFWQTAPISTQFLAVDLPHTWPSPWQLIADNYYDNIAIALGIYYTVTLSTVFDSDDVSLDVYRKNSEEYYTVRADNLIANWELGTLTTAVEGSYQKVFQYDFRELTYK